MIEMNLNFQLPLPWTEEVFETNQIGEINFLVGPNGSGKSQFALALFACLRNERGSARLLGTDRLKDMTRPTLRNFVSDPFATGFAKDRFSYLKTEGAAGSGIDTIVLLEERMDLRIQVEATLSHLFDREITLEWDSGNLLPKAELRGRSQSYRLDRDECHGIKELLVLLTHLYDDKSDYLIIDEPELNLHPQYQSFFMQEVRKVAGDPTTDRKKKVVFLITHSPFILDLRSEDDLNSVISFKLDYAVPKQVSSLNLGVAGPLSLTNRLNTHHKQLFFSDNPIFVEGIFDARIVEALMAVRGVSVAGAGSCIIDSGGAEEVNYYLKLCQGLGKEAYFLYDLDSLFRGNLRKCISEDQFIQSFLASAGLGNNFGKYCGQLERKLADLIRNQLLDTPLPPRLDRLEDLLRNFGAWPWDTVNLAKARIAVMTAISLYRNDVVSATSEQAVVDIEGHLKQILTALKQKNIHLLPGGTLERYLPCYTGDVYELTDEAKRQAVIDEIQELSRPMTAVELSLRYGELYEAVLGLPSKTDVDIEPVLRKYLSDYIYELQKTVISNPNWQCDQILERLNKTQSSIANVFFLQKFERYQGKEFSATIEIAEMLGQKRGVVHVNHQTNAGVDDFKIEWAQTVVDVNEGEL